MRHRELGEATGQLARFLLVGGSNSLLSFGVFHLALSQLEVAAALAQSLAYACGMIWSFCWNRRWTFRQTGSLAHSIWAFLAVQSALLVTSALALGLAVDLLRLPVTPVWILIMGGVTLANFQASRRLVFISYRP